MTKYYEATVQLILTDDKGKQKKQNELYLVQGVSVTDVEAIVYDSFKTYSGEFELKSVKESRIIDILKK